MTDDELKSARALVDAATRGPWRECASEVLIGDHWWRPVEHAHYRNESDAALIAASRSLVPALLAEVERLRAVYEAAKAWAQFGRDDADDENDLYLTVRKAVDTIRRDAGIEVEK